jgi:hypothetical protein
MKQNLRIEIRSRTKGFEKLNGRWKGDLLKPL